MRCDHEIETGGQHIPPVEHCTHVSPAQEDRHHIALLQVMVPMQVAGSPLSAGEPSEDTSQLHISSPLFLRECWMGSPGRIKQRSEYADRHVWPKQTQHRAHSEKCK